MVFSGEDLPDDLLGDDLLLCDSGFDFFFFISGCASRGGHEAVVVVVELQSLLLSIESKEPDLLWP